jgi:hypothetical protein
MSALDSAMLYHLMDLNRVAESLASSSKNICKAL